MLFFLDEEQHPKILDVQGAIVTKYFPEFHPDNFELSLDGFHIPSQEEVEILNNDDIIDVKLAIRAAPESSEEKSRSCTVTDTEPKQKKVKNHWKHPVKRRGVMLLKRRRMNYTVCTSGKKE